MGVSNDERGSEWSDYVSGHSCERASQSECECECVRTVRMNLNVCISEL